MNKLKGEIHFLKENFPDIKPNFSELARETGVSRQTVAKYWRAPVFQSKPRQKKRSKFDPYYPEIREKFENTPTTIMAVFKYFQLKYPGDVFRSYESFKSYVKANRLTELRKELMKPHLRFETGPGEQIQVDWKEDLHFTLRSGEVITYNIYTAVYGYSRYVELIYSPTRTTLDFIRCTIEVMKRAGGRPGEFLTDNMTAVVNVSQGRKRKHTVIEQFEKDIESPIRLARPKSPQTKGKVESANRFIEWLQPWQGELDTEEELIEKISEINREINREPSRTTHQIRRLLMIKEKEHLRPLTKLPVLDSYLSDVKTQKVPSTMLVEYKGSGYSVPKQLIGKTVKLVQSDDELQVYYNSRLVCTHKLSENRFNYKTEHYTDGLRASLSSNISDSSIQQAAAHNLAQLARIKAKGTDK